jgi:hypothetical protein
MTALKVFGGVLFSVIQPGISKYEPFDDRCTRAWEKLYTLISRKMSVGIRMAQVEQNHA